MRILFLIQGFDVPSSRYRVLQYLPHLRGAGIELEVRPFPETIRESLRVYGSAGAYDAVFLHRKRPGAFLLRRLRRCARAIIYDVDDAVMYRDTRSGGRPRSRTRERRFAAVCRAADEVIVGNDYLRRHAAPHARSVTVIPTSLDAALYAPRAWGESNDTVTLGWIGDTGSVGYLERMRIIFDDLALRDARLRLKVVSNRFPHAGRMPLVRKEWRAGEELSDLQSFDIGIMPLSDDPWSQGKCGLKLLQYMAAGVPAVASPVGVNRDILRDGVDGFHAATSAEWVDRILRLATDAPLRSRMGRAAAERVRQGYTLQQSAPRLVEVLRRAAGAGA